MQDLAIFGAGGFGRELAWLIKDVNLINPMWNHIGYFDDNVGIETNKKLCYLGNIDKLNDWATPLHIIIAIGNTEIKRNIVKKIKNQNVKFPTIIHPSVMYDNDSCVFGNGVIICAGSIVTTNVYIDDFVTINLNCTIGHDTIIKKYVSLMPGVQVSGEVVLHECTYVGVGATLINRISIGEDATVAAGAKVFKNLPPRCTAMGNPARVVLFK